jgi:hypothetical protein
MGRRVGMRTSGREVVVREQGAKIAVRQRSTSTRQNIHMDPDHVMVTDIVAHISLVRLPSLCSHMCDTNLPVQNPIADHY